MDIDKNKKIEISPAFGDFTVKKSKYNPALHKKTEDSVSFNTLVNPDAKNLHSELIKTKEQQGLIGNLWDGFKNLTKIGASSNKVEKAIKQLNNGEITKEEAQQILANYQDGQKTCLDVVADMISSIIAVGAFAMAVPTGGTSLPVGLAISTGISTALKVGIKGIDAKANGREYNRKNLLYDVVTGSVNGLLAPVTNGIGSSLTKTIGCKLGLEITGDVLEAGAKSTLKSLIVNQSIDVAGGTLKQRALALGAGMAIDGALGGAADNTAREIVEDKKDKNVLKAATEGFIGGLIMSPIIGGGFRLAGKVGSKIGKKLFPNANKTPDLPNNPFNQDTKLNPDVEVKPEPSIEIKPDVEPQVKPTVEPKLEVGTEPKVEIRPETDMQDVSFGTILKKSFIDESDIDSILDGIEFVSREEFLENLKKANIDSFTKIDLEIQSLTYKNDNLKIQLLNKIISEPKLLENNDIINYINNFQGINEFSPEEFACKIFIIDKYLSIIQSNEIPTIANNFASILDSVNNTNQTKFIDKIFSNPILFKNNKIMSDIDLMLNTCKTPEILDTKLKLVDKYLSNSKLYENDGVQDKISNIITKTSTPEQLTIADKFLSNSKLYENKSLQENLSDILSHTKTQESEQAKIILIDKYLSDSNLLENEWMQKNLEDILKHTDTLDSAQGKINLIYKFLSEPNLQKNTWLMDEMKNIILYITSQEEANVKIDIINKYLSNPKLHDNLATQKQFASIVDITDTPSQKQLVMKFLENESLQENEWIKKKFLGFLCEATTPEKAKLCEIFFENKTLNENKLLQKKIRTIISQINSPEKYDLAKKVLLDIVNNESTAEIAVITLENYGLVSYRQLQKLQKTIGSELFNKIHNNLADILAAANLIGLYGKSNVNEIPITEKRNVLRAIVKNNTNLFGISDDIKQAFPLIPKNQEEYCALLPALVKSLGIEVKTLQPTQVADFNLNVSTISQTLKNIPDSVFNNLTMSHKYPKDDFIKDTLSILKDLPKAEKQKVFDYFGFELHHNRKTPTGYSISGYPVNINNGKKLAQITDIETKEVVEKLRPKVIAFSENNTITSNIPELNTELNEILKALPELHTLLDRPQHGSHEFDVMKHSLKVMQKISQNPNFDKLNTSDKKLMMLASLFHDITKAEITPDPTHAFESSFDAFYIAKKFNLTQDEQIKLYTLINHHEWLKYVNKQGISEEELIKRLQSVAFDFQNDNLFEMAKIFTEADIKSIRKNDGLYDKFGEALETHSKKVEEYIAELQKSKPILPTTKLPKASDISSKITKVNADCSTNIKGLYKKDGLIIIKYNEVEDWEALGFPKGSISRGITTTNPVDNTDINTGNIKFIAHGLDYENQLSNFDAFALPDSDALLSVSYMERPESKYRLFRTQGVLLDVDSKYIHGGGETDSGSGCGKNIDNFKERYLFGGERQKDRDYISNLIKETLNLNEEEYIAFIKTNQNKSMLEIEPIEAREALIKKFALINSNTRRGNREYNEMYISNPKVQACFAYSSKDKVGDISTFIDNQYSFLKNYAKEHNLPFIVFGD